MNAKNNDAARICQIFSAIQELHARINATQISSEDFDDTQDIIKRTLIDGLEFCAYSITEEATNLSQETKERYPDIPWHKVRGFRNRLSHAYGEIDHREVWDAIVYDFPHLENVCLSYAADHTIDLPEKVELTH